MTILVGKCSMGCFFGFKLHIISSSLVKIFNFIFTPGDVDDRDPHKEECFAEELYCKILADKGYISKDLFIKLSINGIQLITTLKNKKIADEYLG